MNLESALLKITQYLESNLSNNSKVNDVQFTKIHSYDYDNHKVIFRELTWKEGLKIDADSFQKNDKNYHFISEKEKRNIIQLCILRILDSDNNEVNYTFQDLSYDFVEKFWVYYQSFLHLSANEVSEIYNCSKKYFDPTFSEPFPVNPLVIEVDYMTKGIVSLSKKEFEDLTMREFEAIQIIMSVKNGG